MNRKAIPQTWKAVILSVTVNCEEKKVCYAMLCFVNAMLCYAMLR